MAQPHVSVAQAQAMQKKRGWKPYTGPTLQGARCVVDISSELFPYALKDIPHPPKKLYVIGRLESLQEGLAIIGARRATPYGLSCAEHFASIAAARGVTVIAGGAIGCDAQAHRSALKANGSTVVFLGGGCDQIYPARNFSLFQDIVDCGGAIVSEHPWDFPPLPYTFRMRNRLIAGLSKATLIVEAGLPSGTFSTADEALESNREVWVIPGAITSQTSAGANRLLYQGAYPIVDDDSFEDALSRTFMMLKQETYANQNYHTKQEEDSLLRALKASPMRLDELLKFDLHKGSFNGSYSDWVHIHLAELQAQGLIRRYPDGRYGPASI